MDPTTTAIKIWSHNINGYDSSREFLLNECENRSFDILGIQEHWLRPSYRKHKGTNRLKTLHSGFDSYATSGMAAQCDQRVMRGRPFGGTGFIFDKRLSNSIRARVEFKHSRVSILELCTNSEKLFLISAYALF